MIDNFKNIPVQTRYEIISLVSSNLNASQSDIHNMFGVSRPTIRKALDWSKDRQPLPTRGRPKVLKEHHLLFIEARIMSNRLLTNAQLAKEIIETFNDVETLNETTVLRARHKLGLQYLPAGQIAQ